MNSWSACSMPGKKKTGFKADEAISILCASVCLLTLILQNEQGQVEHAAYWGRFKVLTIHTGHHGLPQ